ncbi:purine and uridine phosphorylase [Aspergillus sclerotioniger CBS 115572]|uniref:Purine and uridine phosphorylase n=1 Tax=Aspergillus sclerotioniger CBS 115572 TaxID=1450535 RepID=A0A317X821_9EURO|nr:purine and uridine phosphorylase [Aspergillus sclerotioniger CBS 115572]PWY94679.1 purine and uridine phosphorylase [Aspergillus sclerotioniger CBS 115572]
MVARHLAHHNYTVAWVCVLACEVDAARALLDEEDDPLEPLFGDNNVYVLGRMWKLNVVIASPSIRGDTPMGQAVAHLIRTFHNIRFGLLVGVGGGAPDLAHLDPSNDIRLGDVVVSYPTGKHGGVINYNAPSWKDENSPEIESRLTAPPNALMSGVERLQCDHRFSKGKEKMLSNVEVAFTRLTEVHHYPIHYSVPGHDPDQLFNAVYNHVGGKSDCGRCDPGEIIKRAQRTKDEPQVHYGLIASADRDVNSTKLRDLLRNSWGVACLEMEAGGSLIDFPCVFIRGISDYCDTHRSDEWQPYAAASASAYAKDLLRLMGPEQVGGIRLAQGP